MAMGKAYDVFISYARSDGTAATELNGWLSGQGFSTFFDRGALRPGLRWIPALEEAIGQASAVAILVGPHGIGNTQQYERELALVRQTGDPAFPVIPVLLPGCGSPPTGFLQLVTWVDLSGATSVLQQTDALAGLEAALKGESVAASAVRASICPYRGLEPFHEEDALFFCGRDDAIQALVAKVRDSNFVAVVGPSGSGKSSLVFAGLLPALRQERRERTWDVVSLRPGAAPLRALAAAFGSAPQNAGPAEIDAYLEKEAGFYRAGNVDMLTRIVASRLDGAPEKPDRLLIYIDQWEELYAMAPPAEAADRRQKHDLDVKRFIELLVVAATTAATRASVVLTVRADFYNSLIGSPLTSGLLPQQQVNIPPMRPLDLRSAIETPAKVAGLSFAPPELVDRILNDVGSQEGRLPLLQFALKETWERREGNKLTAEGYTEVGGVTGAIEKTAEAAYVRLTQAQKDAARRLFLRLVTPGEGQEDTRARSVIPQDPEQRDVINLFSDPKIRLLVTGVAPLQAGRGNGDARGTVEVAHEALIQRWPTLKAWVSQNRENLRARTSILRSMEEWEEKKSTDAYLLPPGVQLERGKALLASPGDVPIDDIRDYVERSVKKDEDRAAAEREAELADQKRIADAERHAKEAAEETAREATARATAETQLRTAAEQKALAEQRARNDAEALAATRKRMIVGAGVALLAMAALGVFSFVQWRNADRSLTLATNAANGMVSDLAKSMRDRKGMPVELVQDVLNRAQALQQQLVDDSGGRSDVLRSQAEALNEVVLTEFAAGDDAGALRAAKAFVAKAQKLVDSAPRDLDAQRLMSFALNRLGDAEMRAGDHAEALEAYQGSVAIREELAKGGSAQARADLAAADEKVGEAHRAIGGPTHDGEGDQADAASLAIRQALFEQDPKNPERRRDLGLSYEHNGWRAAESNDSARALELFDANVKLREDAQREAPNDAQAQRDLANAYDFQGLALRTLKRSDEALAAFVKSRDLRKGLVALDPKQLDVQRDLAVGYAHCGLAYSDLASSDKAKGEAALDQYHQALKIREALTEADPGNAQWQADLALDLRRIGKAGEDPKANFERALKIVQDLQSQRKLPAQYSGLSEALQADIESTGP